MTERTAQRLYARRLSEVQATFPDVPDVPLVVWDEPTIATGRSYAFTTLQDPVFVAVHPRMLALDDDTVDAIVRHELGHVVDLYYAEGLTSAILDLPLATKPERRADEIAEALWGDPIYYDTRDIQTLREHPSYSYPRPSYLPR